ncbi:protein vein isoform X2 [Culicoides brevitarsis]|uniref:protein vein isoform X2 n=1 Tax=Culicoides brevitarsis TaxID=469753 RepID=UPI00307B9225
MNAQILRKWSPFKSLMYLWLIFLVVFSIIWCPGAFAMHLTPPSPPQSVSNLTAARSYSSENGGVLNYSSNRSRNSSSSSNKSSSSSSPSRSSELDQKLLTTHLHQITNSSSSNYAAYSSWLNENNNKRETEIARWRHRMNEKRNRIRKHRRNLLLEGAQNVSTPLLDAQTLRNRRESLANRLDGTFRQEREHKRYCSARDPAVLAFEAPTVFEGKIKSMSHNRQGPYSVTFECVHVHKQPAGFVIPPKVRLRFETTENRTECDIYRQEFKQRGPIRGDILEQGKLYFLFVKQIDVGNFTILGQPIRKTKKTEKEVRLGASSNYGQRASISSLSTNVTVKEGKRIRLVCRVNGQPPPKVTWFKDDKSLSRLRKAGVRGRREGIKLEQFKTRSRLIIEAASLSDAGKYECRAKNKVDRTFKSEFTHVRVLPNSTTTTSTTTKSTTTEGQPCPKDYEIELCLNGGECIFFPSIDEKSCSCAEGFSGERCQNKDPGSHQAIFYRI